MSQQDERMRKQLQAMEDMEKEELIKHAQVIENFKFFASQKGLVLNDEHFTYSPPVGVTANYPNIVEKLGLPVERDKEGLVNFNDLKKTHETHPMGHGLLLGQNYILLAHPFFRRRFHPANNYAPRFIEQFWRVNDAAIDPYIALDFDRIRINVDRSSYMELDTWYGAKFNRDIGSIKNEVVKLRPPLDIDEFHNEFFFSSAYCFDIIWQTEGNIKSFQSEEFKTDKIVVDQNGSRVHPVRYVHAEYDLS